MASMHPPRPRRFLGTLAAVLLAAAAPAVTPAQASPDTGSWQLKDLGNPVPDAPTGVIVGAVGYAAGLVPEDPYVFSKINAQLHLSYLADGKWNWLPLGQPAADVGVVRGIGAVVGQSTRYDRARPIAFVVGSDGHLWSNTFDGTKGTWTNHGAPTGVNVEWSAGVVAVRDQPSQIPRPYVFVAGDDSTLWSNWWNGGQWSWDPHGTPDNRTLSIGARVGATVTQPVAEGPEYPQVFVLAGAPGVDLELWRRSWNGGGWSWLNHSRPDDSSITKGLGAINYNGAALQTTRLSAFVAVNNLVYEHDRDHRMAVVHDPRNRPALAGQLQHRHRRLRDPRHRHQRPGAICLLLVEAQHATSRLAPVDRAYVRSEAAQPPQLCPRPPLQAGVG